MTRYLTVNDQIVTVAGSNAAELIRNIEAAVGKIYGAAVKAGLESWQLTKGGRQVAINIAGQSRCIGTVRLSAELPETERHVAAVIPATFRTAEAA